MKTAEGREVNSDGYLVLPVEFSSKGFDFKQVYREGRFAIYRKTKPGTSIKHWEAIKILKHEGYVLAGNQIPPSECYPGSESFGTSAYDCMTEDDARIRLEKMIKQSKINSKK